MHAVRHVRPVSLTGLRHAVVTVGLKGCRLPALTTAPLTEGRPMGGVDAVAGATTGARTVTC